MTTPPPRQAHFSSHCCWLMALGLGCHCWHMPAHLSPISFLKTTTEVAEPPAPVQGHLSGMSPPGDKDLERGTAAVHGRRRCQQDGFGHSACSQFHLPSLTRVSLSPRLGGSWLCCWISLTLPSPSPARGWKQWAGSQGAASWPAVPCRVGQHQLATSLCWLCPALTHPGQAESSLLTCRTTGGVQRMAVTSQDHRFNSASCTCGGDPWLASKHECRRLKKNLNLMLANSSCFTFAAEEG